MQLKPAQIALTTCTALILSGALALQTNYSFAQSENPFDAVEQPVENNTEATAAADSLQQLSLTAIPTRLGDDLSLALDPGETEQVTLRVINTGSEAITIRSGAQDFVVFDDAQTPTPIDLAEADNRWSLASWLTITPSTQTIPAGEMASLQAVISIPDTALPGGHYAMVLHQPDVSVSADPSANTQVSGVEQRVGTLLYVMVNGPIKEDAVIREFNIPSFTEFGPVPYSFAVENLSDIHIQPRVTLEIYNLLGRRVESTQFDVRNIFPYTSRDYEGKWDRVWGIGPYTAKLTMSYGTQGSVVEISERFWLLPITIIVAIIVVLLALVASWIAVRRHIIHRREDQTKRIQELESKLERLQSTKPDEFEN